jgi:hypothetical protein
MVVNFRAHEISRDARKLARTSKLILKKLNNLEGNEKCDMPSFIQCVGILANEKKKLITK